MIIQLDEFKLKKQTGFIVLDGLNGSGKSSLQKKIAGVLKEKNLDYILTREPGGSEIGSIIRELVLSSKYNLDPISEVLLFNADRREHVKKVICPNLDKKIKVICDRFYYSTLSFQGYGRGIDLTLLHNINNIVTDGLEPDLVIILDVDPLVGLQRTSSRKEEDKFEAEKLDFQNRLRHGFLELAKELPTNFLILDANQSQDQVWQDCLPWITAWAK